MRREELEIVLKPEVQQSIKANLERDPLKVALDKSVPHSREVASQVKYLQRARQKLPSLYQAQAIIPDRGFEQSSSEESAAAKPLAGESLLDLTCGLGVDSLHFSHKFAKVTSLERDEVLADIVRENLRRMKISNVEVITASAEEYLLSCKEHFDWIYVDPDRRSEDGKRMVKLEDCSPNVIAIYDKMRAVADKIAIKNSPLFDVEEAFRLFPEASVEVVSLSGECKEVMIYIDSQPSCIVAHAIGRGKVEILRSEIEDCVCKREFDPLQYSYLIIPDVALQKARIVAQALHGKADVWSNNSFGFATTMPDGVLGRVERISRIEKFDLKSLKRELKGIGCDITLREFHIGVDELRKRCGMKSGNKQKLAFTKIQGSAYTIFLE